MHKECYIIQSLHKTCESVFPECELLFDYWVTDKTHVLDFTANHIPSFLYNLYHDGYYRISQRLMSICQQRFIRF